MPVAVPATPPHLGRSEVEVAADAVCAIFRARLLPMTRAKLSEVSIATKIPMGDLKDAFVRAEAGLWHPPSTYVCRDDTAPRVAVVRDPRRPQRNPRIPDDATEARCIKCRRIKPVDQFQRRADKNSRRTTCDTCRKRYQRDRYLSVETSERLGFLLRFIVQSGDPCEGAECLHCRLPLLAGQEVVTDDVVLAHHAKCPT